MDTSYVVIFSYLNKDIELTSNNAETANELSNVLIKNGYEVVCVCSSKFYYDKIKNSD